MPQYQGVWTLEQQAQAQSNQQWVTDPNFKNTTLLLQADGTGSGSQNQTFLDGSTNNFFITRNGNTTQGSFSPFSQAPGYWGNYFGGTSDYLTGASNAALVFGTGTYTIEMWVYQTARSGTQFILGGGGGFQFFINSTGYIGGSVAGVGDFTAATIAVSLNTWTHIAIVRNSTSSGGVAYYINGSAAGTATDANNYTTNVTLNIGTTNGNTGVTPLSGYLSNVRVVKGTNVYTSAFTPSTVPLTAITNTSLLACQSNRFVDNSTNALALSTAGSPSVQAFGPFAPALQWTPDVVGGSGYFDGTDDYLSFTGSTGLQFGTGDFTVECWVYITNLTAQSTVIDFRGAAAVTPCVLNVLNTAFSWYNGSSLNTSGITPSANTWYNIVVSRVSSVTKIFVNGTQYASASDSVNYSTGTGTILVGKGQDASNFYVTGYISGLRVVKGSGVTSVTVPTTPPTAITNTQLLLNYTNAGIYDGKMANNLETVGNAQVATSPVKYGSGSMYFDGTGDYLVLNPATTDLYSFGSGDWTIEFWVYLNSVSGGQNIYDGRPISTATTQPVIYMNSAVITYYTNASDRITGSTLSTGQWYHVAVCRANSQTRMFVNGTQSGSTYTDTTVYTNTAQRPIIGASGFTLSTNVLNGYLDDMRVTKGVARYIANFTPPQQALPRQ